MNIIVKTYSDRIIVRPDTTWERDSEDVFLPEFVTRVDWTPVLFARISKPGRSVGQEFASRYYDGIGFGILLYPHDLLDGSEEGFAQASCLDHTSFLPFPVFDKQTLGTADNCFRLFKGEEQIFEFGQGNTLMIEKAVAQATRYCYIRTGDILAIELQERRGLCSVGEGNTLVKGLWCCKPVLDFRVVL